MISRSRLVPALVGLAFVAGCAGTPVAESGCTPTASEPVEFTHATNVDVTEADGYRVLTVQQPFPGGAPESFVLAGCGDPDVPADLASAPVIELPVASVHAESTTTLPSMVDLGVLDLLTGVGTPDFVSGAEARARIDSGAVTGFAPSGSVDAETVLGGDPDVLLGQGVDSPAYPALRQAGIPVVAWADYLESSPLGQAEWIKVMGVLTGRESEAASLFGSVEAAYGEAAAAVDGLEPTPVLVGQLYSGTWTVPTADSPTGTLLLDAGATWSEAASTEPGSVTVDFETAYVRDGSAPIWIADGPFPTRADALAADGRYGTLAAMGGGQLWTRDAALGPTGGNEYYERGTAHPEEVLADLVAILHPDALPGHEQVYFRQVP